MKVYFVRHGQSEGNIKQIHQDGSVKLSSLGIKQAKEVAKRFSNITVDTIISSDFVRAHETAKTIGKLIGHKVITSKLLREIKRPTEIEGRKIHDPDVLKIKQKIIENRNKPNWRYSDEETFFDIADRASRFLRELEKKYEKNILCVTHGDILRNIVITILIGDNYSPAIYEAIKETMCSENTGITMCEYQNNVWRLLTWNDYAHLG